MSNTAHTEKFVVEEAGVEVEASIIELRKSPGHTPRGKTDDTKVYAWLFVFEMDGQIVRSLAGSDGLGPTQEWWANREAPSLWRDAQHPGFKPWANCDEALAAKTEVRAAWLDLMV